ncbi:HTH-type transcriptional repressor of iron proteins A [Gordonia rubripertincta]|nr:HTH-type transcriptional repressor of iron proteins A [Gordonia rubripertincta]
MMIHRQVEPQPPREDPYWDYPRGAAATRGLVAAGKGRGAQARDVLAGTAMTPEALGTPGCEVNGHDELTVARNLLSQAGPTPGLGLASSNNFTLGVAGLLGLAMVSAPTVRDALQLTVRLRRLTFAFVEPVYRETSSGEFLIFEADAIPVDVRDLLVERDIALLARMLPVVAGRPARVQIQVQLSIGAINKLQESFPQHSIVQGDVNVLTLEPDLLESAPLFADRHTYDDLATAVEAAYGSNPGPRGGATREVAARIAANPADLPTMDEVARDLHMDVRTLRRKLAADGTSYRTIANEARSSLAAELLREGNTVDRTAALLGYYDAASFSAAFKRWFGVSPGQIHNSAGRTHSVR